MKKGKLLFEVRPHSMVDVITNSSSELFCAVKAKNKEFIELALNELLEEFGCDAVSFRVYEMEEEQEDGSCETIEGVYTIHYDYEIHHSPCKALKNRIKQMFEVYEN